MKIILEIKNQPSDSANAYIAAKAVETVSSLSMQRQVEYISFSADVCDNVLHNDSTAYVAYVGGKLSPEEAKARGYKCLDYSMKIFLRHPEWIDEAHSLGLHVNMWRLARTVSVACVAAPAERVHAPFCHVIFPAAERRSSQVSWSPIVRGLNAPASTVSGRAGRR